LGGKKGERGRERGIEAEKMIEERERKRRRRRG
jgi:hypothetical protein